MATYSLEIMKMAFETAEKLKKETPAMPAAHVYEATAKQVNAKFKKHYKPSSMSGMISKYRADVLGLPALRQRPKKDGRESGQPHDERLGRLLEEIALSDLGAETKGMLFRVIAVAPKEVLP